MPLLSRAADPLLGVFTGMLAYYLYETHPRTAPPEQDRLLALLKWKQAQSANAEKEKAVRDADIQGANAPIAK